MPRKNRTKLAPAEVAARAERLVRGSRPEDRMTKAQRVELGRVNPEWFCRYYLGHYFVAEGCEFHRELFRLAFSVDAFVGAAPREHAKSTVVGFGRVIHAVCYQLTRFVVILRESDGVAETAVDDIRQEFESNERIREDFGDLVGERKWTGAQFVTSSDIKILGRGLGSSMRGLKHRQYRPDLVILDDAEDDDTVDSKTQRDKLERKILRVVLNLIGPGGKFFMIGTVLHHDSVLVRMLRKTDVFTTRVWRAIKDDGQPLWPARWPLSRLERKRKEIGARNFATEFMNDPANEEEQIFSPQYERRFDDDDLAGLAMDETASIDPAIGTKAKNDDSAVVVVGESGGNYYLLRARLKKLKIQAQVELVFGTFREFPRILKFGFETVAYQSALKQLVDEENRRANLHLPATAVDDISTDKLKRISTLAPLWEQGRIWMPSARSAYWSPDVEKLLEELYALGCSANSHDDGPDALERAIKLSRGRGGRKGRVRLVA
jgi:predicted phage terminase large subunit-like protein